MLNPPMLSDSRQAGKSLPMAATAHREGKVPEGEVLCHQGKAPQK